MIRACRNGDDPTQPRGCIYIGAARIAPGNNRPIRSQTEAVILSCRNGDESFRKACIVDSPQPAKVPLCAKGAASIMSKVAETTVAIRLT